MEVMEVAMHQDRYSLRSSLRMKMRIGMKGLDHIAIIK
jgi:hypothetical protein